TQDITQIIKTYIVNSFFDSYIINVNKDLNKEQYVSTRIKWNKLVEMKKDIQSAE
ncbi:9049_t:CDS:2, partial [Scutellospora calospora]